MQTLPVSEQPPPCIIGMHQHVIYVHTLKILNAGTHIPLFGHTKILHTLTRMGSAALVAALPLPR